MQVLQPLQLACLSGVPRIVEPALGCLHKMVCPSNLAELCERGSAALRSGWGAVIKAGAARVTAAAARPVHSCTTPSERSGNAAGHELSAASGLSKCGDLQLGRCLRSLCTNPCWPEARQGLAWSQSL